MGVLRTLFCCRQQMLSSLFAVASWGSSEFLPSVETSDIFFLRWKCGLHVVGDIVMWVPLAHVGHSTCAFFVHFNRVKTLLVALLVLY